MGARETTAAGIFTCLQQLLTGGTADAGIALCERNRAVTVPDGSQPSLIFVDGARGGDTPLIMRRGMNRTGDDMVDEFECAVVGQIIDVEANIGTALNDLEDKVIKLLATDAALGTLLGSQGKIVSPGSDKGQIAHTDGVLGWFSIALIVSYPLKPSNP